MRWDAQRLNLVEDGALPGMPSIKGLLRSVQVPEFPGITLHEVRSRSALNAVAPGSPMPFQWTINPYRGCLHQCVYCFARKTHEWLELDSGKDFDTQIIVKTNLVDVLERELARPSWRREHVAMGTNTDPYQRAEGRYRLMPGVIRALARSGTPFSILTKGTLLGRDRPLLAAAAGVATLGTRVPPPAPPPRGGGGCARPRRLPRHLGRRPARRLGAGGPDAESAPRTGPRDHRCRSAVRRVPRAGPPGPHR